MESTGYWCQQSRELAQQPTGSISNSPSSNRTFGFPEYGFPIIFFQRLSLSLGLLIQLPPDLTECLEFIALPQSPFLRSFRSMMKVLPLSSPKVMLSLQYKRYYGQLRLPCQPSETSFPYIHQLPLSQHRQGSPAFILVWLPLRVTSVTPGAHLSVMVVGVKIDAPVFPTVGKGRQLHRVFRGYIWVRSRCDPQACSTPLRSLCQETQCFRLPLTPPSSYVGEATEFPWSDFNRQVIRFTRHTLQVLNHQA